MKAGYPQAAWRLFQITLAPPSRWPVKVTWADTELEGTPSTLTYSVTGLPFGASFDPATLMLQWVPGFTQAGIYSVDVTATDDGNGTGRTSRVSPAMALEGVIW